MRGNRAGRSRNACVAVAVVLAGCLTAEPEPPGPSAGEAAPSALLYACPPAGQQRDGVCVRSFSSLTESMQEPHLARLGSDPETMAMAVIGGQTARSAPAGTVMAGTTVAPARIDVYVTRDGGGSWRLVDLPVPPGRVPGDTFVGTMIDPDVLFDDASVLHVVGLAGPDAATSHAGDVFHAMSADFGATWSSARWLTAGGTSSFPFLGASEAGLFVSWHELDPPALVVARSADGGRTWSSAGHVQDCGWQSPFARSGAALFVACGPGGGDSDASLVRVFRWDATSGGLADVGRVSGMGVPSWEPFLAASAEGRLVLASPPGLLVASSDPAGEVWSGPIDLLRSLRIHHEWRADPLPYWMAADAWGGVHLLIRGEPADGGWELAHVTLTSAGQVLAEKRLAKESVGPTTIPERPATVAARSWPDDVVAASFTAQDGVLLWSRGGGVEYTRVVRG